MIEPEDMGILYIIGLMILVFLIWGYSVIAKPSVNEISSNSTNREMTTLSKGKIFCNSININNMVLVEVLDEERPGSYVFCTFETKKEDAYRSCIVRGSVTTNHGIIETMRGCE